MLRPLNLDYAVQPGFIWITKPEIIERESFEKVETHYYELRNAGSETLFKIVLRNPFGGSSTAALAAALVAVAAAVALAASLAAASAASPAAALAVAAAAVASAAAA
jgi:hypothetical protein